MQEQSGYKDRLNQFLATEFTEFIEKKLRDLCGLCG